MYVPRTHARGLGIHNIVRYRGVSFKQSRMRSKSRSLGEEQEEEEREQEQKEQGEREEQETPLQTGSETAYFQVTHAQARANSVAYS